MVGVKCKTAGQMFRSTMRNLGLFCMMVGTSGIMVAVAMNINIGGDMKPLTTHLPDNQVEPNIDGNYYPLPYSKEDLFYMTQALYFEARSEPVECQQMVASVIMTRKADWYYPDTVKDVVWENRQFSYTQDGKHERMDNYMEYQIAEEIAHAVLAGLVLDTTEGSLYYHNPNLVDWPYKDDYHLVVKCGDHDFYRRRGMERWN